MADNEALFTPVGGFFFFGVWAGAARGGAGPK